MKKIMAIIYIIVWMIVIFNFSSMDSNESNKDSKAVINKVVEKTISTNDSSSTTTTTNNTKKEEIVEQLNTPLRKVAHFSIYFILSLLILNYLSVAKKENLKNFIICFIICFLYASSDEAHQLLVSGRTGQFTDVLIDSSGALIGILFISFLNKINSKKTNKNLRKKTV